VNVRREGYYVSDRGAATAANAIPKRKPDAVVEEKTQPSQAALYRYASQVCKFNLRANALNRLSGDRNPLHVSQLVCSSYVLTHAIFFRYCPSSQPLAASTSRFCTVSDRILDSISLSHLYAGLCFFGFAGKHVLQTFGPYKEIKTRCVHHKMPTPN
jgi:hypothetical protein